MHTWYVLRLTHLTVVYEHQGVISAAFFYVGRATRNTIINPRDETKTQGAAARTGAPSGRISNPLGPNYHRLFFVSLFYALQKQNDLTKNFILILLSWPNKIL